MDIAIFPSSLLRPYFHLYSFNKYIVSTYHVLGTIFQTGDREIKNLLPILKGVMIQWGSEIVTLWR